MTVKTRKMVCDKFDEWGVKYLPSSTNFVFFQNDRFKDDPVDAMAREGFILRKYEEVTGWTRVSMGTVEDMENWMGAMGRIV